MNKRFEEEFKIFKKDLNIYDSIDLKQDIRSGEKDFLRIALRVLKKYIIILLYYIIIIIIDIFYRIFSFIATRG